MKLIIGNKNYSSWSMRAWLVLRQSGIPFEEERLSFNQPDFAERVRRYSPVRKVPVLVDRDLVIWDSLAIAEYVHELAPEKKLWPEDRAQRARARSLSAEMHSGFAAMRSRMPLNCDLELPGVIFDRAVQTDIARITSIWQDCRRRNAAHGPFLFGSFTIADAYFAPVTRRFLSYGVSLEGEAAAYTAELDRLPAMRDWLEAARAEKEFVDEDEPYRSKR